MKKAQVSKAKSGREARPKLAARAVRDEAPPDEKRPGVTGARREDDEVPRLRLGGAAPGKEGLPLASARDDGVLGEAVSASTVARSATATQGDEANLSPAKKRRTRSEAMNEHWRLVRAGLRPHPDTVMSPRRIARDPARNPLLRLPERQRSELFVWLRECPYEDAVRAMIRKKKLPEVTPFQIDQFFQLEAENQWRTRTGRATQEASALVRLAEDSVPKFSAGILAALGQEAFRQVVRGDIDPDTVGRWAALFMKARSDERTDQMQELRREKLRHDLQEQIEHALEKLAEEVERHPEAREAFEALRRELTENQETTG
jgi:hypothetical protein